MPIKWWKTCGQNIAKDTKKKLAPFNIGNDFNVDTVAYGLAHLLYSKHFDHLKLPSSNEEKNAFIEAFVETFLK